MHLLVFDSGIGGLGVVREIRRLQPGARISYLADNGFFPYGEKPDAVLLAHIVGLIGKAIDFLKPDAVVVACNTASTIALGALRAAYALPFIGCVPPIKPAAAASKTRVIGILATAATVRRTYLQDLIEQFAPDCEIHSLGAPTLAELAEQKFRGHAVDVASAVAPLFSQPGAGRIDAVALGCTHYTFLRAELAALYPLVEWFDPALGVARRTLAVTENLPAAPMQRSESAWFTAPLPDFDIMLPRLAEFGFYEIRQGACFA
jgi:glutamate racemase